MRDVLLGVLTDKGAIHWVTNAGGVSDDPTSEIRVGPGGVVHLTGNFNIAATFNLRSVKSTGVLHDSFLWRVTTP